MKSIRSFLLVSVLGVVVLCLLIFSAATYFETKHEVEEIYDAQLAQSARLIHTLALKNLPPRASITEPIVFTDDKVIDSLLVDQEEGDDDTNELLSQGHLYETKLAYQLWTTSGQLLLRSSNAPSEMITAQSEGFTTVWFDKRDWRTFTLEDKQHDAFFVAAEHLHLRNELVEGITNKVILPYLIGIPLLIIVLWQLIGRGLAPLVGIRQAIQNRSPENLDQIHVAELATELQPVETALNTLFQRLGAAIEREKSFTDDAAHELRTPLATIKLHAQNALASKTELDRDVSLGLLDKSVDQATRTIEQLLQLARLQSIDRYKERELVQLDKIARNQIAQLDPLIEERQQEFDFAYPTPLNAIQGNDILLGLLMRNIIENACLYTPEQGKIRLSIKQAIGNTQLIIEDSGIGVSEEAYQTIFQRFHRERPGDTVGAGLGLSIVSRIAELHHALIKPVEHKSPEYSGFGLVIEFPNKQEIKNK